MDSILEKVPTEKLLEFDERQIWKQLCELLGKPVPEGLFPHVNERVISSPNVVVCTTVSFPRVEYPVLRSLVVK